MATDVIGGGNIEPRALEDEMRSAYLDYAMSVIVGRALPDVRDGLKPVHRRVLYAMSENGLTPTRPYVKCARIVREVTDAVIAFIDNRDITVEELIQRHVKGPDFPTGGVILGRQGIRDAYATGRGRVRVRAKAHIEDIGRGKEAIIVTELPFMVKK